eukprot:snap_masked-scaffold_72-processed-gene-0.21-mRNA-1 protein AED:0.36 eAED:0.36 QI:0/-1/0/1/-1/1/1/0/819
MEELPVEAMDQDLFSPVAEAASPKDHTSSTQLKFRRLPRPKRKKPQVDKLKTGDGLVDKLLTKINNGSTRSYKEVYTLKQKLGEGAFAKVYLAIHNETGKKCALKVISLKIEPSSSKSNMIGSAKALKALEKKRKQKLLRQKVRILESEIGVMRQISKFSLNDKRGLMCLEGEECFANKDEIVIPLELLSGGELFDRLLKKERYSEKDAAYILRRVIKGVKVLHQNGIVHRDLKPENLVFETEEEDSRIKITDYGLAFHYYNDNDLFRKSIVGSPGYIAPEILKDKFYTPACDIWAMGCILFILLVGGPPFAGEDHDQLFASIKSGVYYYPTESNVSDEAKDLVSKMLNLDPNLRITAAEILKHPWLLKKTTSVDLLFSMKHLRAFNARKKLKNLAMGYIVRSKTASNDRLLELLLDTSREGGFSGKDLVELREVLFQYTEDERQSYITADVLSKAFEEIDIYDLPVDKIYAVFAEKKANVLVTDILVAFSTVCKTWKGKDALKFCFEVYDSDGSGKISLKDMQEIMRQVLGNRVGGLQTIFSNERFISFQEFSHKISRYGPDWQIKEKLKRTASKMQKTGTQLFRSFSQMTQHGVSRAGRISSTLSLATIKSSLSLVIPGKKDDEDFLRRMSSSSSRSRSRSRGRSSSGMSRSYSLVKRQSTKFRRNKTGKKLASRLSAAIYKSKPKLESFNFSSNSGADSMLSEEQTREVLDLYHREVGKSTNSIMRPSERQKSKKKLSTTLNRRKTKTEDLVSEFVDPKSFLFHKTINRKRNTMQLRSREIKELKSQIKKSNDQAEENTAKQTQKKSGTSSDTGFV